MAIDKNIIPTILWSAIEDDVGLWEIAWELSSTEVSQKDIADTLAHLLKEGLIKFHAMPWIQEGELTGIQKNEALKLLDEDASWVAPKLGDRCIVVSATQKGEQHYEDND